MTNQIGNRKLEEISREGRYVMLGSRNPDEALAKGYLKHDDEGFYVHSNGVGPSVDTRIPFDESDDLFVSYPPEAGNLSSKCQIVHYKLKLG